MTNIQDTSLVKNQVHRVWKIVAVVVALLAAVWLSATASFEFNAENTRFVAHVDGFGIKHNCLTGYTIAAYLASAGTDNIYNPSHYLNTTTPTPIHNSVQSTFTIDTYHYPPPFLILPEFLLVAFGDFFAMRAVWFIMTVTCFICAITVLAWWCGAFRSKPQLLLFPILLCAPTVHVVLQIGNAHLLIIALSILGMIAIEEDRFILGGGLLGFAVAAKLWPAVLVVYLLLQKRWKPALSCAVAVVVYALVAFVFFGPKPYSAFLTYEIPRISNGESFSFMSSLPRAIISNMSIFGIPQKLHALGLLSTKSVLIPPVLSWIFTVLVVVIVIAVGLLRQEETSSNDSNKLISAQLWLALLTLVQLRSPFLPWPYGVITTLSLLFLLSVSARGWKLGLIIIGWIILSINVPFTFLSDKAEFHLIYTLLASLFMFGAIIAGVQVYWVRFRNLHTNALGIS